MESAFSRAWTKEQETKRQQERAEDIRLSSEKESRAMAHDKEMAILNKSLSAGSSKQAAEDKHAQTFDSAFNWMTNFYNAHKDQKETQWWTENDENGAMAKLTDKYGEEFNDQEMNYILYEARKKSWGQ